MYEPRVQNRVLKAPRQAVAHRVFEARVAQHRRIKKAAERGLDPNQWFFNVEKIAAEEVGRETVDYVANINKYYLAYRLQYEATRQREALKSGSRS